MDAAQKLLKNIAILTAAVLLLSTVGLAAPPLPTLVVNPTTVVAFNGSVDVSSSDGTTPITFTVGIAYSPADQATPWLSVAGSTTTHTILYTTPRYAIGLPATAHTATVTLTPTTPAGVAAVQFTATFDTSAGGGGGGGGSTTLTASQNTVNLTTSVPSTIVTITNSSASALTITGPAVSTTSGGNWLGANIGSFSLLSNGTTNLTITAYPTGLPTGTYQGSVVLTPSPGTALTITVNLTVGGGGSGNWSVTPSSIAWNFSTGSGNFPIQAVQVSTSSGAAAYNVTASSSGGWLLASVAGGSPTQTINGIPIGTLFTLSVSGQANTLIAGQYSGQAIITDQYSSQQATVNVTLTVNGGTSSGLTISPSTVSFTSAVNGAQQSYVVNVTSSTGGTLNVSGCGSQSWLTCTLPSNTSLSPYVGVGFTVYANPAGLAANTYNGTLGIQVGSQSGTLNVSLVVGGGGGGGTGALTVAPTTLNFAYESGTNTAFIARQKLVITGQQGAWTATVSSGATSWLSVSPASGSALPDPSQDSQTPVVSINPAGLTALTNTGTITINAPGGQQVIQVSLNILSSAILLPTPGTLIFTAQTGGSKPTGQSVYFSGSDGSLNPLSITAAANNSWIGITPGASYVSVFPDQTGLTTGVYSGSISVSQSGAANNPVTVPVILVVNGGSGTSGTLSFSQNPINFTSTNGVVTPTSTVLTVSSNSTTTFTTTISYTQGTGWLTVNPAYGATDANLSVSASSAGLANGTYNATINFNANGTTQTVTVTMVVTSSGGGGSGNVSVSPTTLGFTTLVGSNPANQTLSLTSAPGSAGVAFTVTSTTTGGGLWLSASPTSGTTPVSLTVSVNSSAMAAGSYYGNVIISPNGGTVWTIPVSLTITTPATVSATPTALTFTYRLGDATPAAQTLTVSGGGASLQYTVTPTSSSNWLVATPASGTTPGTVSVSVNTANINASGTLNGTVLVAGASGAGSTTVAVTLSVTAPLPTVTKVTNAASYASGSIAPGEIITLFASDSTHPIGPATPAGLTLDANGNVATTIGGVQVTVNGYACPMIYASATQVSAVVPYEVMIFPSASVLVKFLGQSSNGTQVTVATTVPGLFTANSSGTGPGAILNSNYSPNSPSNPAARGDVVVVYMTGEGATSPAGVTGKVTTVASPPLPLTPAPLLPVSVTVGGQPASWFFAGEAPGFVSGVMQLNLVVPTNIQVGDQPIVVTIGGNQSQAGVTVSVK